jgi:GNAT superfamily N-acetyltransferase
VVPWRNPDAVRQAVTGWMRTSVDASQDQAATVLVAVSDRGVVGVVTVGSRRHFTGELDAYVGELVVADTAARRGVGTLLMRAAERWARDRGFTRVTLETGAANRVARQFYRVLGYLEEDLRLTKTIRSGTASNPP